jgi:hypothetical protein
MSIHRLCGSSSVRIIAVLALSTLAAGMFSCSGHDTPVEVADYTAPDPAVGESMAKASAQKWTFLLYAAADAGPNVYCPLEDFAEQFTTGDNIEALVIEDTYGETAKIWYIDEDHKAVLLEDLGEINMGSVTTLSYFLEYAKSRCPADRYIISFYGHGGAWGGACNDLDPSFDVLRMDDMKEALTGAGGVDLVLFSAPCLMGTFEGAYELRECTDVYIGSEGLSFYAFWRTVMGSISMELNDNPNIRSHELGELIIEWIAENRDDYTIMGGMRYLTMSAVRTDRLRRLSDALDELALAYMSDPERFMTLVESVRDRIVYFESVWIADLNSLLLNLYEVETDAGMRDKIERAVERLSDAVIAEVHLPKYKDIKGLSIFLPDEATANLLPVYVDQVEFGLDFVPDAHWDELLFSIFPAAEVARYDVDETSRAYNRLLLGPE